MYQELPTCNTHPYFFPQILGQKGARSTRQHTVYYGTGYLMGLAFRERQSGYLLCSVLIKYNTDDLTMTLYYRNRVFFF